MPTNSPIDKPLTDRDKRLLFLYNFPTRRKFSDNFSTAQNLKKAIAHDDTEYFPYCFIFYASINQSIKKIV